MSDLAALFAPDDRRDHLRKVGGLLAAAALLMIFIRKSSAQLGDTWGDWGLLLVLLVTFVFLYGTGLVGRSNTAGLRSWESVYLVFGIFVAPLVGAQFVEAVNGTPGAPLNIFWIFGLTAVFAVAAAVLAGVRYGLLLAAISWIVSWSALWDKILSGGLGEHLSLYRWLLLIIAALLLAAAFVVPRDDEETGRSPTGEAAGTLPPRSSEFVTGASIAAVVAGAFSFAQIVELSNPLLSISGADSSFFWELVLLVVSVAAIAYGARVGARGPVYVGGFGLFFFLLIAGLDLNSDSPDGKIVGWPLALLILGLGAFLASLRPEGSTGGTGGGPGAGTSATPPGPPVG